MNPSQSTNDIGRINMERNYSQLASFMLETFSSAAELLGFQG